MTKDIKNVYRKFEQVTGMRVAVNKRAGDAVKHVAKAEPLKRKGCGREDCSPALQEEDRAQRMGLVIE